MKSTLGRIAPALVLLGLAPLVAEFLLGDFSIRQLGFIVLFVPQYGGGALLVREVTRRAKRGWVTMLLLALAYALIEEGLTTQSLFNPNYAGERLLDYGYLPALGISPNWTLFVLTLHIVWSLGSSIAIAEAFAGPRWKTPWLGRTGLAVTAALYLAGCALTAVLTHVTFPYVASEWQFAVVGAAVIAVVLLALVPGRPATRREPGEPPAGWTIVVVSLAMCSAFYQLQAGAVTRVLPAPLTLGGMLALQGAAILLFRHWSAREAWGPRQALAAATGAILTYGWISIARMADGATALGVPATTADLAGQVGLVLAALAFVRFSARRLDAGGTNTNARALHPLAAALHPARVRTAQMAEVLVSFERAVRDDGGEFHARAVGARAADGMWDGWIEFVPVSGVGDVLVTGIESRQPERTHLEYWATGLSAVYLEGALHRARDPVRVVEEIPETPATSAPARREHRHTPVVPGPEPVLDPLEIGSRSLDILRQELHALNRPRLLNIIDAFDLNPGQEDLQWMSDHQLVHFIVVAVDTRLT